MSDPSTLSSLHSLTPFTHAYDGERLAGVHGGGPGRAAVSRGTARHRIQYGT